MVRFSGKTENSILWSLIKNFIIEVKSEIIWSDDLFIRGATSITFVKNEYTDRERRE